MSSVPFVHLYGFSSHRVPSIHLYGFSSHSVPSIHLYGFSSHIVPSMHLYGFSSQGTIYTSLWILLTQGAIYPSLWILLTLGTISLPMHYGCQSSKLHQVDTFHLVSGAVSVRMPLFVKWYECWGRSTVVHYKENRWDAHSFVSEDKVWSQGAVEFCSYKIFRYSAHNKYTF